MKITATCKCGSRIEVDGEDSMDVKGAHREWEDRHFDCLRPPVVLPSLPPWTPIPPVTCTPEDAPCPKHGKVFRCDCAESPPVQSLSAEKEADPAFRAVAQQELERDISNIMRSRQPKCSA